MNIKINLGDLSRYRTELMGIATIMILLCHAQPFGVHLPTILNKIFTYGNQGVDIFLFLSGMGLYYSLEKIQDVNQLFYWYKKRYKRILIPYFIIATPFFLHSTVYYDENIWYFISLISTISFWTDHIGAWYIAMLIPIYLFAPEIKNLCNILNVKRFKIGGVILAMLFTILYVIYDMGVMECSKIVDNIFGVLSRVPSFCIGMGIAPLVKKNVEINFLYVIILSLILYSVLHHCLPDSNFPVLLAIPLLTIYILGLRYLDTKGFDMNILTFMGVISLESYLTNVFFGGFFHRINWGPLVYGNYIPYLCVIISGICCSVVINRCVNSVLNKE